MTTGQPGSVPPTQMLLEAVWCIGQFKHGSTEPSCRFCRISFQQAKGLWKYAVGHYICGDCRGLGTKKLSSESTVKAASTEMDNHSSLARKTL